jgi:secreted Zn-dependent insulinase-like peptidase
MPEEGENLGNAPPNLFMPKAENLISMKLERQNPEKASKPELLELDPQHKQHQLFFKQDDSFDQPFIIIHGKIFLYDSDFPICIKSKLYGQFWQELLAEALRETDYCAQLAGINSQVYVGGENVSLRFSSYNDNIENYISHIMEMI